MMILADSVAIPAWGAQLGIALPFVLALAYLGKWLLARLAQVTSEKDALYDKVINDVVPALAASTNVAEKFSEQQKELAAAQERAIEKQDSAVKLASELLIRQEELRKQEQMIARKRGG